jgi:hypothetical protein
MFYQKRGGHFNGCKEEDEDGSDGFFGFKLDFINSVRRQE